MELEACIKGLVRKRSTTRACAVRAHRALHGFAIRRHEREERHVRLATDTVDESRAGWPILHVRARGAGLYIGLDDLIAA